VDLRGSDYTVRNNSITGVGRGIVVGPNSLVEGNTIDGFVWDGLRGVGNSTFRDNLIKNCLKIDDVHRDGFQSYSKGTVRNLKIEGNVFIEWTHATGHPLRAWMQGISLFDGYYENLIIQNNIVAVRHSNGIAVLGAKDSKILNNTVVHLSGKPNKYPIIRIKNHKDGTPPQNVVVANNLASKFEGGSVKNNVVFKNNTAVADPAAVFMDVTRFNYLPKAKSGFVDTGASGAPGVDIRGYKRPGGAAPDRGAYEVNSSSIVSSALQAASRLVAQ
jgi:hypothetical protein